MLTPEPTQVALKRFIDDISVEVMEAQLVSKLSDILSAMSICDMSDETVSRLAGESEESRAEREQLNRQVQVLQYGLETCKRFASVRMGGGMEPLTPATLIQRSNTVLGSMFASVQDDDVSPDDDASSHDDGEGYGSDSDHRDIPSEELRRLGTGTEK